MNKYSTLQNTQQERFNALPIYFAFGNNQFEDLLAKLGAEVKELFTFGAGSIMKKKDKHLLVEHYRLSTIEDTEAMKDDAYIYQMFICELGNHEYGYTYDMEDTLNACGYNEETIREDPRIFSICQKARKDFIDSMPKDY